MIAQTIRVLLATEPVDLRAGFDRLAAYARGVLNDDPVSGTLFVFINRRGNRLKALWWDGNGYALLYKRLSRGSFTRIESQTGRRQLTGQEFSDLVAGLPIDASLFPGQSERRTLH